MLLSCIVFINTTTCHLIICISVYPFTFHNWRCVCVHVRASNNVHVILTAFLTSSCGNQERISDASKGENHGWSLSRMVSDQIVPSYRLWRDVVLQQQSMGGLCYNTILQLRLPHCLFWTAWWLNGNWYCFAVGIWVNCGSLSQGVHK